jgi:hypothetical protein
LPSARLEPAALPTALQQAVEQDLLEAASYQPRAKLAQRRVMKTLIAQLQAQGILPVNARPHGVCRLPVTQILGKLHHTHQRQLPRMQRRLPFAGVDQSEEVIGKEGAQFIADAHVHVATGKRGASNAGGLSGNRLQGITRQAHLSSLLNETPLPSPTMLLSRQFANSIVYQMSMGEDDILSSL